MTPQERRTRFFELHTRHAVFVMPNPWDIGSAKLLAGAGFDVPGLNTIEQIRTVVEALGMPVNVLALPGGPSVREIGEAGARRVSTGGDAMVSGTTPRRQLWRTLTLRMPGAPRKVSIT